MELKKPGAIKAASPPVSSNKQTEPSKDGEREFTARNYFCTSTKPCSRMMRLILLLCAVVVMVSTTRAENDPKDLSRIRRQESSSSRPTCSCPRDGRDGLPGSAGATGPSGRDGERGPPGPAGETRAQGPAGGGVVYTRWGRTTCPPAAGLVYDGLAAGSHYNHYGGSADVLCLVKTPKYNPGTTTVNTHNGVLYGSEYNIGAGQALNSGLRQNHNVPCAVCHVSSRSSQLMVPGTYQCPSGWTPEYTGWLMGGHYGHKGRNMFTCVDKDAEVVPGQAADTNGNLFQHMEADCGTGLPCPPYDSRKELSCVVCTK